MSNVLAILLEKGLPSREVQIATASEAADTTHTQLYADNLNLNGNMQLDKVAVAESRLLPLKIKKPTVTNREMIMPMGALFNNIYIPGRFYNPDGQEGRQFFVGPKHIVRINISFNPILNSGKVLYFMDTATPISRTLTGCVLATYVPDTPGTNQIIECDFHVTHGISVWATGEFYKEYLHDEGYYYYPDPETLYVGLSIGFVVQNYY